MNMLKDAKRLWKLGLAIHWVKPKSKAPVESGWTKGKRKSWVDLKAQRPQGANLGVRLGAISSIERDSKAGMRPFYLGVIDCDVKSEKSGHLREMVAALDGLWLPDDAPRVMSGRGNGSCHIYVVSPKPLRPRRVAQSPHKVKVKMPSVKPSAFEKDHLTEKEIKAGVRLRPAWEISIMGEGQQVVLPPSIHPDSGRPYKWATEFTVGALPVFIDAFASDDGDVEKSVDNVEDADISLEPFSFTKTRVPQEIVTLVVSGENSCGNRSEDVFKAARAMRNCGLPDSKICWALTEESHWISSAARDRRGPSLRSQVEWIKRHTLRKIKTQSSPQAAFKDAVKDEFEPHPAPEPSYYEEGKGGKLTPNYEAILTKFESENAFRTIADMKTVFVFKATHYVPFTPIEIKGFTERLLKPKPSEHIRTEFMNKVLANNIVKRDFFMDNVEGKINFKNGILDLSDGEHQLQPHSADFGFRGVLPYDYNPKADCPRFRKWIKGVMCGDEDLVAILQEFMGYVIRGGEYKFHKALWLEGKGRNGKSTFLDVLKGLIGPGNYSTISIKAIIGDKFAGADLDGKIANFSEETSPQELADSGPFKNLTGDGDLFVQKKFGDPYSFRNRAKLIMSYNQIPDLKDLSKGMLSRPIVIPFRKTIEDHEQDKGIKQKLLKELPGIFNFALEGWERLEANNDFSTSERSTKALERIAKESCNVHQWIKNCVRFSGEPNDESKQLTAYQLYGNYRGEERYPYRFPEFARRLKTHPTMKEHWKRDMKRRYYWGVETE